MSQSWWKSGDVQEIWKDIEQLEQRQRSRAWRDQVNEAIYGSNVRGGGLHGIAVPTGDAMGGFLSTDLNYVRTIVDALVARVADDRPAIHYAADGASWTQRRKARQLEKVIEGEIDHLEVESKMDMATRDALVTRAGLIEVMPDGGRINADRFPVEELRYDEREARYGMPRRCHRVMLVSKDVLLAKFPDKATAIANASPPPNRPGDEMFNASESGMVEVAKSWHLRSSEEADDGWYYLTINGVGGLLDKRPYKRDRFPVMMLSWAKPRRGLFGGSLVDELAPLQYKVNEIARDLQQNVYFTSALKVFTRRGADIAKKTVPGKRPHFVDVDAIGPDLQFVAPDGFSMAQFQFLQWHIDQMYALSGVSQLMAQGKNPLGAGASGAALNEVWMQDSERFSQFTKAIARGWKELGELIVWAAQDLADDEEFKEREVSYKRGGLLQRIKWGDVDLDCDRYEMHLEASGYLPSQRAGKMQAIEQLVAAGLIGEPWASSLIDFPDLKNALTIKNAPVEYALWAMEELEDVDLDEDGELEPGSSAELPAPDPHVNLEFVFEVAKAVYNIKLTEKTPRAVLDRYTAYMDTLDMEIAKKKAAAPQPAPTQAGAPMPAEAAMLPPMSAPAGVAA